MSDRPSERNIDNILKYVIIIGLALVIASILLSDNISVIGKIASTGIILIICGVIGFIIHHSDIDFD